MKTGSHWMLPAIGLSETAQDFLQNKSFPVDNWKEIQPAETKPTTKNTCSAAQRQTQPTGQKPQGKQAKHVARFKWVDRFWKAPWNPSEIISYSFAVQSGDVGYSCKKQGLFETAKFKYSHWNRIEISCQDQSRKPEHTEHLSLQGNKILKLHKIRIRVLNPNVFVILKYNSLQVFMAVADRMGISFSRQAPLFHHSCYQAVDLFEKGRVPSCENKNIEVEAGHGNGNLIWEKPYKPSCSLCKEAVRCSPHKNAQTHHTTHSPRHL